MKQREPIYNGKTYEEAIRRRAVIDSGAMDMTSSVIYSRGNDIVGNDRISLTLDTDIEGDEMLERADEGVCMFGMRRKER